MYSPHLRPHATASSLPAGVPPEQARALDRRHALDEQQRAFRGQDPKPYLARPRPPG